ncbi:MAG: hypothetical protein J7576_06220 [Siphonobacter aquaeclarae]|nr:hypothetical protein [Siphonobacter aquaeclarae]
MNVFRIKGLVLLLVLCSFSVQAINIPLVRRSKKVIINGEVVRVREHILTFKVNPEVRLSTFDTPWGRRQFDMLGDFLPFLHFLKSDRIFAPPSYMRSGNLFSAVPLLKTQGYGSVFEPSSSPVLASK